MRKLILNIIGVAVIVAIALIGYQRLSLTRGSGQARGDVQVARVEQGTIVATVFAVGNVVPQRESHLTFPVIGTVKGVRVAVGDPVEAGQVLAALDTADLEREVTNAELALAIREAELARLKAGPTETELASAQAALKAAEEALATLKAGPNPAEVAAARSALNAAQTRYELLKAQPNADAVRQAQLQLEQAKNSLWHAQAQRDMACSVEGAKSLCDAFEAEVGNGHVAVQMAELALQQAQSPASEAELQSALAEVQAAQARLNQLLAGPSAAELAAAEAQVAQAKAQLEKLTGGPPPEELRIAEARVQQAKLALQQAQRNLAEATLRAPFAGVVTAVNYAAGDTARPDLPGIIVADPSQLYLKVNIAEVDIAQIQVGQEAEVILDAMPDHAFAGQVTSIAPAARSELGVVNYPVTVAIAEADPRIKPGMTGNVRITVGRRENVLVVPNRAIRRSKGQHVVAVWRDGQPMETPVRIGFSNDTMTEVVEGLRQGELVVLNPTTSQSGLSGGLFGGGGE